MIFLLEAFRQKGARGHPATLPTIYNCRNLPGLYLEYSYDTPMMFAPNMTRFCAARTSWNAYVRRLRTEPYGYQLSAAEQGAAETEDLIAYWLQFGHTNLLSKRNK
jgi:hypothetical protein